MLILGPTEQYLNSGLVGKRPVHW